MSKILYITNVGGKRMAYGFSGTAIEAAHSLGHEFYAVANRSRATPEEIKEDEEKYGIRLLHMDVARSPFSLQNLVAYKQLVKLIQEENIDYIHCNTPIGGILGRLAGKKCKVKRVIYQAHGFHFYKGAPLINWLLYYPVEKWLAHYTDALITINREDYELAKKKFKLRNGGKVYYVPGVGIDTAQYTPNKNVSAASENFSIWAQKRVELGIPLDAFLLISAGDLNINKNNRVIISAMEKLNNKQIHYVLCGVGDQQAKMQKQADDAGLHDNIHFLGFRTDIKELYETADCFVMPSLREGLSRSMMEAMASGLPCIASRIRGNTDLLEGAEGGFLCNTMDVDDYAEKLNILANDAELRAKMGEHNLRNIVNFGIETVTEEIRKIYDAELG